MGGHSFPEGTFHQVGKHKVEVFKDEETGPGHYWTKAVPYQEQEYHGPFRSKKKALDHATSTLNPQNFAFK